jgi:hypothetical protein
MQIASLAYALESLSLSDRATVAAVHGCDELQMMTVLHHAATWQRLPLAHRSGSTCVA